MGSCSNYCSEINLGVKSSPRASQIGNCVSLSQSKPFLRLLALTPLAINISAIPVVYPIYKHLRSALQLSFNDPWIRENWWDWKWSWIVYGGPFGRYVIGIVYGYRALQRKIVHKGPSHFGDFVKEPRLALAGTVLFALLLGVFTVVSNLPPCKAHAVAEGNV